MAKKNILLEIRATSDAGVAENDRIFHGQLPTVN